MHRTPQLAKSRNRGPSALGPLKSRQEAWQEGPPPLPHVSLSEPALHSQVVAVVLEQHDARNEKRYVPERTCSWVAGKGGGDLERHLWRLESARRNSPPRRFPVVTDKEEDGNECVRLLRRRGNLSCTIYLSFYHQLTTLPQELLRRSPLVLAAAPVHPFPPPAVG